MLTEREWDFTHRFSMKGVVRIPCPVQLDDETDCDEDIVVQFYVPKTPKPDDYFDFDILDASCGHLHLLDDEYAEEVEEKVRDAVTEAYNEEWERRRCRE